MKDLDNVAKYWSVQLNSDFSLYPGEERFFPDLLDLAKGSSSVLEVGVGKGRMVRILRDAGAGAEFHGVDITDNVFDSSAIGARGDARDLPYPDETFDLAYSLGVVEHFPETAKAVAEHGRVVKRGGHVLITVPRFSIHTFPRFLVYLMVDRKKGSFEEIRGRNISLSTMKRYFREAGLSVEKFGTYGFYGISKFERILRRVAPGSRILKGGGGAFLYILGKKR